jgi:hypothetical protein
MRKLLDRSNQLAMFNTDRMNDSVRYGISYWLWGNETIQTQIETEFAITP